MLLLSHAKYNDIKMLIALLLLKIPHLHKAIKHILTVPVDV